MKYVIAIIFAFLSMSVAADESSYSLVINNKAFHFNSSIDYKYNEDNFGLGLQYRNGNLVANVGNYKDSYANDAYYVGAGQTFKISTIQNIRVSVGYNVTVQSRSAVHWNKDHEVDGIKRSTFVFALPVMTIEGKTVGTNIAYIPRLVFNGREYNTADVLFVQTAIKF